MIRARMYRRFWLLIPVRLYIIITLLRCKGSQPALCGGRYGIMRQYCMLPRWHRGDCAAPINAYGQCVWSYFKSGKRWNA